MANKFLYGIDFCFTPTNPGNPDGEGHYPLGFGFIQRADEQSPWTKVAGFSEPVKKNEVFGFQFYDLSQTLGQIDFATIAFRPDPDDEGGGSGGAASNPSPFSDADFRTLDEGKTVPLVQRGEASCGCAASGNGFYFGTFTLKNTGDYEMTVEIEVTRVSDAQKLKFKCDPRVQVGP
jgi:hypothetical protein